MIKLFIASVCCIFIILFYSGLIIPTRDAAMTWAEEIFRTLVL